MVRDLSSLSKIKCTALSYKKMHMKTTKLKHGFWCEALRLLQKKGYTKAKETQ